MATYAVTPCETQATLKRPCPASGEGISHGLPRSVSHEEGLPVPLIAVEAIIGAGKSSLLHSIKVRGLPAPRF